MSPCSQLLTYRNRSSGLMMRSAMKAAGTHGLRGTGSAGGGHEGLGSRVGLWGKARLGVKQGLGSVRLWTQSDFGVSQALGSVRIWGQPGFGVSQALPGCRTRGGNRNATPEGTRTWHLGHDPARHVFGRDPDHLLHCPVVSLHRDTEPRLSPAVPPAPSRSRSRSGAHRAHPGPPGSGSGPSLSPLLLLLLLPALRPGRAPRQPRGRSRHSPRRICRSERRPRSGHSPRSPRRRRGCAGTARSGAENPRPGRSTA